MSLLRRFRDEYVHHESGDLRENLWGIPLEAWWEEVGYDVQLITLAPALCEALFDGTWRVFHSVAVTMRTDRARIPGRHPNSEDLADFRAHTSRQHAPGVLSLAVRGVRRAGFKFAAPVEVIIDLALCVEALKR